MMRLAHVLISASLLVSASGQQKFQFDIDKHLCGVCQEVQSGLSCERFGACDVVNPTTCKQECPPAQTIPTMIMAPPQPDVRITKGFGTKAYNQIRVSVISEIANPPVKGFFDHSAQFKYRWTDKYLHTGMKAANPGAVTSFDVGSNINVKLPAQGAGVAGVLLADPCMGTGSITSMVGCFFAKKFDTNNRIVGLINAFVPDASTDFWGIFGDNFYDRTGEITTDVFSRISLKAKSKLYLSVAGNHDYWVLGTPDVATTADQCGNGHMQFSCQDAKSAEHVAAGNSSTPFDFSTDPSKGHVLGLGCSIPKASNMFWYNQIGNVGLVGQSGAHSYTDSKPFMQEACTWLSQQPGLEVGVLFGHWDVGNLGASKETAMPMWYTEMAALPGCAELDKKGMLKFVMGHSHCNDPHPHGKIDTGFRVAGFGMEGCGNFGMPLIDTTEGRVRFWYFDTSSDALYNNTISCVTSKGWRQCTSMATLWLNQTLPEAAPAITV